MDRLPACKLSREGKPVFQAHPARHQDEILTFLYRADIEATNWPAEQAMRPAVVNRKVFGGNRPPECARAQEVCGSGLATHGQKGVKALGFLSYLIRSPTLLRNAFTS